MDKPASRDDDERKAIIESLHDLMEAWGNNQIYYGPRAVVFRAWRYLTATPVSERGLWINAKEELPEDGRLIVAMRADRGAEICYGEVFNRNLDHVGTWAMTHWFYLPALSAERSDL